MGNQTIKNITEPSALVTPYMRQYLNNAQTVASRPYQGYTGNRVAGMNNTQYDALDAIKRRAMGGTPEQTAGRQQLTSTLNGSSLNRSAATNAQAGVTNAQAGVKNQYAGLNNPYLNSAIDSAQGDVVRNFNLYQRPQMMNEQAQSGSFGNSGLQQVQSDRERGLASELGDMSNQMRMGNYNTQVGLAENAANRQFTAGESLAGRRFGAGESLAGRNEASYQNERGRQMGALGYVPQFANMDYQDAGQLLGAGNILQGQTQRGLDDQYSRFTEARDYPQQQLDIMGRAVNGGNYGSSSSQTQPGGSRGAGAIGGALAGATLGSQLGGGWGTALGAIGGGLLGGWG